MQSIGTFILLLSLVSIVEIVDKPHGKYLTRTVRNQIPFEISFDLGLKIFASANVKSDHLRVASALIETSVLEVDPDSFPIAKARLEFVTLISWSLVLDYQSWTVPLFSKKYPVFLRNNNRYCLHRFCRTSLNNYSSGLYHSS